MSLLKHFKNKDELQPISIEESKFFKEKRSEGAPYVFYNNEEFCDLMGHGVTYYPTGILLYIKDINKDYPTSRSYVFYNNNKQAVLRTHNRRSVYNQETRATSYLPPVKDIEIKVFKDYIYVKETVFETQETNEYLIDVQSGEKLTDLIDGQQISAEI